MSYAIYKNKIYISNVRNMKIILKLRKAEKGFTQYVDLTGKVHDDIFTKEVSVDDVDIIYNLEYKVEYKGREFIPWAVGKFILETGKISLGTNDEKEAKIYNFEKMEQFVFKKDVSIDEVDALIEIKKPILKFQDMEEKLTRIEQKDIRNYINNLLE